MQPVDENTAHQYRIHRNAELGLPVPPSYGDLLRILQYLIRDLSDASSVVDAGADEPYAYAATLVSARMAIATALGQKEELELAHKDAVEVAEYQEAHDPNDD